MLNFHENTSLLLLGSNHPTRLRYLFLSYLIKNNIFIKLWKTFSNTEKIITKRFLQHTEVINQLKKNHLIFIGDSHVEYFSRSKVNTIDFFFQNCSSIWLGPKTVLGFSYQKDKKDIFNKIFEKINMLNFNKKQKICVIWSMGNIDIRYYLYEMLIREIIQSDSEILELFDKSIDYVLKDFLFPIKRKLNVLFPNKEINIAYSLCSNTIINGNEPETIKKINQLKKLKDFPTFGTIRKRQNWTKLINKLIINKCKNNQILYYEHILINEKNISLEYTNDGIHLTDPNQIDSANLNFLNHLECNKNET